tara:strand:+ start:1339 stop:1557 length:219 start_codon:yes stop_codon:yes gene_type:complete
MGAINGVVARDGIVGVRAGAIPVAGVVSTEVVVFTVVARSLAGSVATGVRMSTGIVVVTGQRVIGVLAGTIP